MNHFNPTAADLDAARRVLPHAALACDICRVGDWQYYVRRANDGTITDHFVVNDYTGEQRDIAWRYAAAIPSLELSRLHEMKWPKPRNGDGWDECSVAMSYTSWRKVVAAARPSNWPAHVFTAFAVAGALLSAWGYAR